MLLQSTLGSTSATACTEHPWEHNWGCHHTSATVPGHCYRSPSICSPACPSCKTKTHGRRWEQRAGTEPRGAPVQVGRAQTGISQQQQQQQQLLCVEAPSALRFGKLTFLTRRHSRGIGSQNPHQETHWLMFPACTARGCPGLPLPQAAAVPTLQGFQAWLKYFNVILVQGEEPSSIDSDPQLPALLTLSLLITAQAATAHLFYFFDVRAPCPTFLSK